MIVTPIILTLSIAWIPLDQHQEQPSSVVDRTLQLGTAPLQSTFMGGGTSALGASSGFDDFNRADGPLGADWGGGIGSFVINNNELANIGTAIGWVGYNAATSLYDQAVIEFDLLPNPTALAYGAAITGAGGSDNTYTKIQSNSGNGFYDFIGFYHLNGSNGPIGYGSFVGITPVTGGRVRIYVSNAGDTMNVDIDEDIDGVFEYHYENPGIVTSGLAASLSDGVGISAYGSISRVDNFSLNGAGAEPILAIESIVPDQYITFNIENLSSGSTAVLVLSSVGPGPTVTPYGEIEVSLPWRRTPLFPADANGVVNFTSTLPPGASGATFYMQAVEFKEDASTLLTNALVVPLL
ncbi:MAG: hypothetical protein COA70_09055 [Planctomycetota bacterium]|nr:MAG: hypothetical protein COA70_09055 [Planctomycetota bacterium]